MLLLGGPQLPALAAEVGLGPPVSCAIGRDCFLQQFADVAAGPEAVDPFCGSATYDGHNGIDIRVLSMTDAGRGVDVIAMGDGEVLRSRDGVPDRLILSQEDEELVRDRECGNGLVIGHAGGVEAQYCHLKQGSVAVAPGDRVTRGQKVGEIGASGLAEFPHVHVTLRRNGVALDPVTGVGLGGGCEEGAVPARSLLARPFLDALGRGEPQLLASGVSDAAVHERDLVQSGPAVEATAASPALVGWVWLINLAKGDALEVTLVAPDGSVVSENAVPPLDRSKATYVAYAGRKIRPPPGDYSVKLRVRRDGKTLLSAEKIFAVR